MMQDSAEIRTAITELLKDEKRGELISISSKQTYIICTLYAYAYNTNGPELMHNTDSRKYTYFITNHWHFLWERPPR